MGRRLLLIYFICVFVLVVFLVPVFIFKLTSMLISAIASINISGEDIIRVVSVSLESARTGFGILANAFRNFSLDTLDRISGFILLGIAIIAITTWMTSRKEVKK